jgi:hypothetical protein
MFHINFNSMAPKPQPGLQVFKSAMKELKPFLPRNYGVILKDTTHPDLDFYRLRQAVALRAVYWEGYEALKTIAKKEPVERPTRKKHERRQPVTV